MMQADENVSISVFDETMVHPFLDESSQKKWSFPKPSTLFRSTKSPVNGLDAVSFFSPQKDNEYDHLETSRLLQQGMPCRDLFSVDTSNHPFAAPLSGDPCRSWLANETGSFTSPIRQGSKFEHQLTYDRSSDIEQLTLVSGGYEQPESPIMDAIRRAENDFTRAKLSSPSIVTPLTPTNPRHDAPRVTEGMIPLVLNDTFLDMEDGGRGSYDEGELAKQLSWKSIEAFDMAVSSPGIERQLEVLRKQKERKSKLFSLIGSAAVVMAVGYFVAGFFQEDVNEIPSRGSPKLIIPFIP